MPKKVQDLAKQLGMESEELLAKAKGLGIEAEAASSVLSDMDAKVIENMVLRSRKGSSSTVVKSTGTSAGEKRPAERPATKTEVKMAAVAQRRQQEEREKAQAAARMVRERRMNAPTGTPMPKSASKQTPVSAGTRTGAVPPAGIPLRKGTFATAPVGKPLPKSESVQTKKEAPVSTAPEAEVSVSAVPAPDVLIQTPAASETPAAETSGVVSETVRAVSPEETATKPEPEKQEQAPAVETKPEPQTPPEPEKPKTSPVKILKTAAQAAEEERLAREARARRQAEMRTSQPAGSGRTDRTGRPAPGDNRAGGPGRTGAGRPGTGTGSQRPGERNGRPNDRRPQGANTPAGRYAPSAGGNRAGGSGRPFAAAPATGAQTSKGGRKDRPDIKKEKSDRLDRGIPGGKGGNKGNLRGTIDSLEKVEHRKPHKKAVKQVEEPTINIAELEPGSKIVSVPITVAGLAEQIDVSATQIIMALMKMGVMANMNYNLDEDTVVLLGADLGVNIVVDKVQEEDPESVLETEEDSEEDLQPRPPIVTVMGHVDHGKTSLLDAIRKTNVTAGEAGGITQHIGASEVWSNGQKIVFLDTPGHEAFTAMRARGAFVTDVAVLVVAADDSVKPQTIEAISHAKAAGVPIVVAINKIDKPGANIDRVKQDLMAHNILVEDYGGETIAVPVSAKTGEGIDKLLEMILLQAEVLELKANPKRLATGSVIEARLDKSRGAVASLLVKNGTLEAGQSVVCGNTAGRIRVMTDWRGKPIKKAGPGTAVEILGLPEVPQAGDDFNALTDERQARAIAEARAAKQREEVLARNASTTLDQLFASLKEGEVKDLNIIIKADVNGSVGALVQSLEKLHNENVRVRIVHTGVGTITESDIMLAKTSGSVIIGFNVRPSAQVQTIADRDGVEIRTYQIIYEIIEDIEAAMKGMLEPVYKEVILGHAEVRSTFRIPNVGIVAGCYVQDGKVARNAKMRLLREGIILLNDAKISSLKRFKDDAKEVREGFECGIGIENFNDIREGDIIEAFEMQEVKRD